MSKGIFGTLAVLAMLSLIAGCRSAGQQEKTAPQDAATSPCDKAPVSPPLAPAVEKSAVEVDDPWRNFPKPDELWIIEKTETPLDKCPSRAEMRADIAGIPTLPLRSTRVQAQISGFVSTVEVVHRFYNPSSATVEAVYTFPLPQGAAVTDFVISIGDRQIRGMLREREDAEEIYRAAQEQGYRAALVTREKGGAIAQQVGNLAPGAEIDVTVTYFGLLPHSSGEYEFAFPVLRHKDLSAPPRNGSLSLKVSLDAGVGIEKIYSPTHAIDVRTDGPSRAAVSLKGGTVEGYRDFALRYRVAGTQLKTAMLADAGDGKFVLILQPPAQAGTALNEVEIDWGTMAVSDVYPRDIPEVAGNPVIVTGSFRGGGKNTVRVSGRCENERVTWAIDVDLSGRAAHPAVARFWALCKIQDLSRGKVSDLPEIIRTSLEYHVLCRYTAFLAVDTWKKAQ